MRDDPFYLSKALTLKASLGVLSIDGNFEDSIAYLEFFVKFKLYTNLLHYKVRTNSIIIEPLNLLVKYHKILGE